MMRGVELIAVERERQVVYEGLSAERDDEYRMAELGLAGLSYVSVAASQVRLRAACMKDNLPIYWPFQVRWWKPSNDPIRNLVKAGALIAAEIDRLQRLQEREKEASR